MRGTFTLDDDEFDTLLLMMAIALGASIKQTDKKLARRFLHLANVVNKDNPNWRAYEIPPEETDV